MQGPSSLGREYNLSKGVYPCCFNAIYKKASLPFPFSENNNPNMDPGVQSGSEENPLNICGRHSDCQN